MSNTSYSFKENSHLLVNQGGEKKVMKKILSVALSTAMAFSMFASVAFGADAKLSPEQQFNALKEAGIVTGYPDGLSHLDRTLTRAELAKIIVNAIGLEPVTGVATYKDKNYTASHWAAPYIEAATAAGILEGKDTVKGLFDPTGNVTVQELAKVLVTALDLEVPADAENTASPWAKGFVAAAVKDGYIAEGINYQAAATRSQAVVAAYAIYEASQVPEVKEYKVVDPKNVEFTMTDGEVVKVELETALEANKETEVKFTYQDREYTHKVTYVTTVAQKVQSVKADNLKQVVVTFDGTLDKTSAEEESNYEIDDVEIDSAKLSEDKTTVTLLLEEGSDALDNKKETKLDIVNVKNEDGTVTFNTSIDFTPADVTAPTIKEVVGLGTKAFKVVFSEPVDKAEAGVSGNYEIDGGVVGGSVEYVYPNTAIISANLSVGEHKVAVSDVEDFSGLRIAPVEIKFEVEEDTAAPEIASIESKDLKELTIKFNETIKNVEDVYVNTSSNDASTIDINDNEVTITLEDPINYNENTVYVKGVSDYSGNKADRDGKVSPTLDTIRPIITKTDVEKKNGEYVVELTFSEKINENDAKDEENYVLKDADGKIADVDYIDKDGHPELEIFVSDDEKKVTINLGSDLDEDEEYALTVSGIADQAYVKNMMVPQTVKVDTGKANDSKLDRVWMDSDNRYIYIQFSTDLATSGKGSAIDTKFVLSQAGSRYDYDGKVNIYNTDTIRLDARDFEDIKADEINTGSVIEFGYIADKDGDYIRSSNGSYSFAEKIEASAALFRLTKAEVKSTEEVKLEFNTKVNSYSRTKFIVAGKEANSATLSSDKKTLTLKFTNSSNKLPKAGPYALEVKADAAFDAYGNEVVVNATLKDKVAPELETNEFSVNSVTGATYYELTFEATEDVFVNAKNVYTNINKFFEVKAETGDSEAEFAVTDVVYDGNTFTVKVELVKGEEPASTDRIAVKFDGGDDVITDEEGNALGKFVVRNNWNN